MSVSILEVFSDDLEFFGGMYYVYRNDMNLNRSFEKKIDMYIYVCIDQV